jgi:hypothetical protein
MKPPFPLQPKMRANLSPGALYAIDGERGWVYYGQITPHRTFGSFRFRTREIVTAGEVLRHPVMSHFHCVTGGIGDALRTGKWVKLGRFPVHEGLAEQPHSAMWSFGALTVTVWQGGSQLYTAAVDDPRVQDLEVMSVWSPHHLPDRLEADFGAEPAAWHVGGPVWRERLVIEEYARRFPDQPSHQLPPGWVPVRRS